MKMYVQIAGCLPMALLLFFSVGACHSATHPTVIIPKVDTSIYAILPYDSSAMLAMSWRYKNARPAPLTRAEVDDLESIIDSAYFSFTKDTTVYLHNLFPLPIYRRQYVAVITEKGDKEVWVNFICGTMDIGGRVPLVSMTAVSAISSFS